MPRPLSYTSLYPEVVRVTPENCEELVLGHGPTLRSDHRVSSRLHHSFEAIPTFRTNSSTPDSLLAPRPSSAMQQQLPGDAGGRSNSSANRPQSCQPSFAPASKSPAGAPPFTTVAGAEDEVNPRRWRRSVAAKRLDLDLFATCGPLRVASALPTAWNRLHAVHEVLLRVPTTNAAVAKRSRPPLGAASANRIVSHGPANIVSDAEIQWAVSATTGASLAAKTAAVEAREQRLSTRSTAPAVSTPVVLDEDGMSPEQALILSRSPPPLPVGPPRHKVLRLAWEVTQARQKQKQQQRDAVSKAHAAPQLSNVQDAPQIVPASQPTAAPVVVPAPSVVNSRISSATSAVQRSEVAANENKCIASQVENVFSRLEELENILKIRGAGGANAPTFR